MKKVLAFLLGIWILSACSSSDGSTENAISPSVADSIYRPAFHYSPTKNWMGAPVSMVFHNNEYHLFYEYNADGTKAKSNSWGHATSADMMRWKELSFVSEMSEGGQGSIVSDALNTSGLGQNVLVSVTSNDDEVNLSYSASGQKWIEYGKNPVLEFAGTPKVSWVEDRWIMAMTKETEVTFFSSPDLIGWSQESQLTLKKPATSAELFSMQDVWGLILNRENNVDVILGQFDGSTFNPSGDAIPFDLGSDHAAGTVMKTQDRSVFIGLMSNKDYMSSLPTKTWKSLLTLPRELSVNDSGQLMSFPVKERTSALAAKRRSKLDLLKSSASNWYSFEAVPQNQDFEIALFNEDGEKMLLTYNQASFTLDRSKSGLTEFDDDFSKTITSEYVNLGDTIQLDIFMDRSSVEIFINDGVVQFSSLVYPRNPYKSVGLTVHGELRNVPAIIYDMEAIMFPPPH